MVMRSVVRVVEGEVQPRLSGASLEQLSIFLAGVAVGALARPVAVGLHLTRWHTARDIPSDVFATKGTFTGVVTSVSDGDTIRVRHMPLLRTSANFKGKLSDETIVIRIGAVDCPEIAHFGSKGQPFGEEAKAWVKERLLNKRVTIKVLSRDQYYRVVGMVYTGRLFKTNLSKELLKNGLAQVYRQGGAQYDGEQEEYEAIEARAKKAKKGIWSLGDDFESAADYKTRLKDLK
eukprot:gnl/TRDRNA2_/TRDRNA2_164224_c0_seq1.p1 gnl/TRDRNA2_/TRDRNA2_164224_c0~~gnl/TRDRNA2_/TRDRNA2_164224_c0_seq1.p1  ORF type:complete len:233 (+),score=29.30 gnl/TRDRNA2_/TRDRNA2_164224_c0_seq1:311-1009(+)